MRLSDVLSGTVWLEALANYTQLFLDSKLYTHVSHRRGGGHTVASDQIKKTSVNILSTNRRCRSFLTSKVQVENQRKYYAQSR